MVANHALYSVNGDVQSCRTNITAKILAGSEEKPRKNTGCTHRTTQRASVFALVEVRLLRVSTARALDDNIRGIATSPHAVFNALALNQL